MHSGSHGNPSLTVSSNPEACGPDRIIAGNLPSPTSYEQNKIFGKSHFLCQKRTDCFLWSKIMPLLNNKWLLRSTWGSVVLFHCRLWKNARNRKNSRVESISKAKSSIYFTPDWLNTEGKTSVFSSRGCLFLYFSQLGANKGQERFKKVTATDFQEYIFDSWCKKVSKWSDLISIM